MACDICSSNEKTLVDLRTEYQTENVKQICPACEKTINDHLWKIRAVTTKMNQSLLKRFMEAMKARLMGSNVELRGGPAVSSPERPA